MDKTDNETILEKIESQKKEILTFLSRLVSFETPNPPGKNFKEAQQWFADRLAQIGCKVDKFEIYPGEPNVVGVLDSKKPGKSIILNGHMDVAEVRADEHWMSDPFVAKIENDRIYGRGADDMKGGLTSAYMALDSIQKSGLKLKGKVIFESVVGEEVGELGTLGCIERGYKADLAIVPEPTSLKIGGQGGVITGWVTVKSPITLHDGMRRRIIHAGGGLIGASAVEKMMKIIGGLQELERHWAVVKTHPQTPSGSTTINPAVIKGGRNPAFIADECKLWITVHFLPNEKYETVTKEIEDHVLRVSESDPWLRDNRPTFKWGGSSMTRDEGEIFPACEVDQNHEGVRTLMESHKSVIGTPAEVSMWPSVSDSGWLARAGIPTVNYGPGDLEQAHAVNEFIRIDDVLSATKVYALTLLDWCGYEK